MWDRYFFGSMKRELVQQIPILSQTGLKSVSRVLQETAGTTEIETVNDVTIWQSVNPQISNKRTEMVLVVWKTHIFETRVTTSTLKKLSDFHNGFSAFQTCRQNRILFITERSTEFPLCFVSKNAKCFFIDVCCR